MGFNYEHYNKWLYDMSFKSDEYTAVFDILNHIPFIWSVANDDNRADDGLRLRREYLFEYGAKKEHYDWDLSECSFIEMLIGNAKAFSLLMDKDLPTSVMRLMRNTRLSEYTNSKQRHRPHAFELEVTEIANTINHREYDYDGSGGLYPLNDPPKDQRNIEIYAQMNQYINEYGW